MDRGGHVLALDDGISLGERRVRVALLHAEVLRNVRRLAGVFAERHGGRARMDQWRAVLHRRTQVGNCGQDLVLDLDQLAGHFRDMHVRSGDRSDGVALVQDGIAGEDVVGHVLEVALTLAHVDLTVFGLGEILVRNDGVNAIECARFRHIDPLDAGVRVRAAEDFAVEQAGKASVATVDGSPGYLVDAVVANGSGTDDPVFAGRDDPIGATVAVDDARGGGRRRNAGGTVSGLRHGGPSLGKASQRLPTSPEHPERVVVAIVNGMRRGASSPPRAGQPGRSCRSRCSGTGCRPTRSEPDPRSGARLP